MDGILRLSRVWEKWKGYWFASDSNKPQYLSKSLFGNFSNFLETFQNLQLFSEFFWTFHPTWKLIYYDKYSSSHVTTCSDLWESKSTAAKFGLLRGASKESKFGFFFPKCQNISYNLTFPDGLFVKLIWIISKCFWERKKGKMTFSFLFMLLAKITQYTFFISCEVWMSITVGTEESIWICKKEENIKNVRNSLSESHQLNGNSHLSPISTFIIHLKNLLHTWDCFYSPEMAILCALSTLYGTKNLLFLSMICF